MSTHPVLVLNCGSSSLKFAVLDAHSGEELISGIAECLGLDDARVKYKHLGNKEQLSLPKAAMHDAALNKVVALINDTGLGKNLIAVGHRVVHGGEAFTQSVVIDDAVLSAIESVSHLAPLHNPANLLGIRAATEAFSHLPQVAVFDTAFHQTMPEHAYLYALPYSLYKERGVRRYGFHGTSHFYVATHSAALLEKPAEEVNLITAHLGNGSSVTAIKAGKSVDTSMGLTPLEGLMMGTRSGDVDPGLLEFLANECGYSVAEISALLNKSSGFLGVSESSSDCRTIEEGYEQNDPGSVRALNLFCYRLAKQIAAYLPAVGQLDAIVFTGGIGENSDLIREKVINHLSFLGIRLNSAHNKAARFGEAGVISEPGNIKVVVMPTNEELVIAKDALRLVEAN